jgi:hypothetical protein
MLKDISQSNKNGVGLPYRISVTFPAERYPPCPPENQKFKAKPPNQHPSLPAEIQKL